MSIQWDGQRLDPEQHMVVFKLRSEWVRQATEAWAELEESVAGRASTLAAMQPYNPDAFSRFVEAYYAIAPEKVADDIIALAGLRPVDQVIAEE